MGTNRMESVGREIQREIANIVLKEIDDPLIGFVTITDVEMSADLRHAKVFFSVLGEDEAKETEDSAKVFENDGRGKAIFCPKKSPEAARTRMPGVGG